MASKSAAAGRRVDWKRVGRILFFLAFFFLLLEWQERDYAARGDVVEGVVTEKAVEHRPRKTGTGTYRHEVVFYRFTTPEGGTFEGRSDVLPGTWNRLTEGGPVAVEYKRDFPGTSRVVGQVAGAGFWWQGAILLAMLGLAALAYDRRKRAPAAGTLGGEKYRTAEFSMPDAPAQSISRGFEERDERHAVAATVPTKLQFALRSPLLAYAILTAVGAILCLIGLSWLLLNSPATHDPSPWIFGTLGVAMLGIGGWLTRRDWRKLSADRQLLQDGEIVEATVTAVEQTGFSVNRVRQWRIAYRYTDAAGRAHRGRSSYLVPEDASGWQAGDKARIRVDARDPARSVWAGRGDEAAASPGMLA
jgi:hypothetical protein